MTRITFDWLMFFVGVGLLLLASGESTVSAIAEQTTPDTKEHSLLSVAVTSSPSVDGSSTSEHLQTDSGHIPPEDNELKSNRSMNDDESSNHSSTHVSREDTASTIPTSSNETTVEDNVEKAELHKSETRTDMKIADESDSSNEVTDAIQNENHTSSNSDTYLSTSEANTAPVTSGDKKEVDQSSKNPEMPTVQSTMKTVEESSLKEQSTEKSISEVESKDTEADGKSGLSSTSLDASTKEYSESETKSAFTSEETDHTTKESSEVDTTEDTDQAETTGNPVTMETKSSLSAKSATRKRSINSTFTTTLSDESLPTSILFSSPSPQRGTEGAISNEVSTLLNAEVVTDNDFSTTKGSVESISPGESETTESNHGTSGMALPLVYPHTTELETENSQGIESKTENSVEMVHGFDPQDSGPESMIGEMILHNSTEDNTFSTTSESTGKISESVANGSNLKPSKGVSHFIDVEDADGIGYGVTFDPDGMKNDGPQDPDSVVFSILPQVYPKERPPQTVEYSTNANIISEGHFTESATEQERESNPGDAVVNRTQEFVGLTNPNGKDQSEPLSFHVAFAGADDEAPSVSSTLNTISYFSTINPSGNPESQQAGGVSSSPSKHAEANYSDFEMLQDAPQFFSSDHNQSKSGEIKVIEINTKTTSPESSSVPASSSPLIPGVPLATEATTVEASSSFIVHQTEQSVIRPVKIKIASPSDSTSIQPASEELSNPSVQTTGSAETTARVDTNSTDMPSPIILPNPAPSTTEKGDRTSELSTLLQELSSSPPDKAGETIATETANSTIAGVAVKTSVSVSLPLSNTRNDSGSTLPSAFEDLLKNSSIVILPGNPPVIYVRPNNDSSSPATAESDGTTLTAETTTAAAIRILKPKIKIPGGSEPRTRKPYIPTFKRATSTAGPPVSIFSKSRTRGASITSSTTSRPFRPMSTIRVHYASHVPGMVPGGELLISTEPVTEPPTTTEEYFSEEPFTDQTYTPSVSSEDDVTLVKVAGYIVLERGIRWKDQFSNRHSPEYKEEAKMMHLHLERLFRSSSIAYRLWKIEIDGFSGNKKSRSVAVDFFLYLIKSHEEVSPDHLVSVLHEKLSANNTFARFRVDPSRTAFERLAEERMVKTTPAPDQETVEPPIPQWAIAVIVIGAASLIFIVLFAAVTMYGRHHMRRRYSSKLNEEDMERSSGEWESKMAAAYENMAADTIYDAEDLHSDTYKKSRIATFHGIPSTLKRCDSWSSNGWTTPPKRKRPHVH